MATETRITIRIPADLHDRATAAAEAERISYSAYIRRALSDALAGGRPEPIRPPEETAAISALRALRDRAPEAAANLLYLAAQIVRHPDAVVSASSALAWLASSSTPPATEAPRTRPATARSESRQA